MPHTAEGLASWLVSLGNMDNPERKTVTLERIIAEARAVVDRPGDVFVICGTPGCGEGAIYVPEVGPMGDSLCESVEEAMATGQHWEADEDTGVTHWLCPRCREG